MSDQTASKISCLVNRRPGSLSRKLSTSKAFGLEGHGRAGALQLLLDPGAANGTMGDGLLPLHLFARASFDFARDVLMLEPR